MTRETGKAHKHHHYLPEQLTAQAPASPVPILPPYPGQQGYWKVPPPPAPGALLGQPTEWVPVIAYGWVTSSRQASILPPLPANPEWTALDNEGPIPIDQPAATAPDSAAGDQGQAPPGFGEGVDWFVVPIPAPPGNGGKTSPDGPSDPTSDGSGGEPSSKL